MEQYDNRVIEQYKEEKWILEASIGAYTKRGELPFLRRYALAYIVKNTSPANMINLDGLAKEMKGINEKNVQEKLGINIYDAKIAEYLEQTQVSEIKTSLFGTVGRMKNKFNFIGLERIDYKNHYYFKDRKSFDFEKKFEGKVPDYEGLREIILEVLS